MEESKKCDVPKCTSKLKSSSLKTGSEFCNRQPVRWAVSSGDIEHLSVQGHCASLKRKNGGSSSAPPFGKHSIAYRKGIENFGKSPYLRKVECNKIEINRRSGMAESTILEEDLPVIVRRRGCTLRVRITSITDADVEAFEKECVSFKHVDLVTHGY